jgi:large subunit ribosomal protein L6
MSRIGKQPVSIPPGVEAAVRDGAVIVKGKLGTLEHRLPRGIQAKVDGGKVVVTREGESKQARSLHGLTRAIVRNMVEGVTKGYEKQLEIVGVSYQAALAGNAVRLKIGLANDLVFPIPPGVNVEIPNPTSITVRGADRRAVGQFAAQLRAARPPEPYKGKGVRYRGEHVERKQGKSFVASE